MGFEPHLNSRHFSTAGRIADVGESGMSLGQQPEHLRDSLPWERGIRCSARLSTSQQSHEWLKQSSSGLALCEPHSWFPGLPWLA